MNKNQEYWNILGNITNLIKYSDTKAAILLTLYGVIITIVYSNSADVLIALKNSNWTLGFSFASLIFSLISIVFAFLCINPRLKNENSNCIIYFGNIQKKFKTADEYSIHSTEILSDETGYQKQLAEQIHTNSTIAWKKFSNVAWSIRFFAGSLVFIVLSILSYLLLNQ